MWADLQLPADLVTFAEKIFHEILKWKILNFIFCTVLFEIDAALI